MVFAQDKNQTELQGKLREWIARTYKGANLENIKIEHPVNESFGDYSTNVAMILAKKEDKNPADLAREIKYKLDEIVDKTDVIEKIETVGGYINFYLKTDYLKKEAEKINFEVEYRNDLGEYGKEKTVVIDYSAPNIAKPFGIGHLRSTNIGQALYNIYKILGWKCIGDNHLGDWGTQFGKQIAAIKKWGSTKQNLTIEELEKLYVKFHDEAEKDKVLEDEGREWFAKLEKGDKEARDLWQKCVDISMNEFDRVYEILGVKIDIANGEAFYEKMLPTVTKEIIDKGITKNSQNALIVEFSDMPPAMLKKSDGATTYFTRDMATIKYRVDNWNPDLIIYEVGAEQKLHFRQVFRVASMMGWIDEGKLVHIGHGLIRWATGKFSTRKGDTIHLSEVINKAIEKAKEVAEKSAVVKEMPAAEKEEMFRIVGIGAIKFNDLLSDPKKDIVFDWKRIMSLDGNSGPYVQYTYARCQSVLRKTKILEQKDIEELPKEIAKEEEALLREFYRFEEKIIEAAERYNPSIIAEYLLSVARKYNEFYDKHRIIDTKEEVFRIFLTKTTASALHLGAELLGIKTVEKM